MAVLRSHLDPAAADVSANHDAMAVLGIVGLPATTFLAWQMAPGTRGDPQKRCDPSVRRSITRRHSGRSGVVDLV